MTPDEWALEVAHYDRVWGRGNWKKCDCTVADTGMWCVHYKERVCIHYEVLR